MKDKTYKLLNSKVPIDINNKIIFIPISFQNKYLNQFLNYSKFEKFYEFFEYKPFKTMKDATEYLKKNKNLETGKFLTAQKFWFLIDNRSKKLIGTCKLTNISSERKSLEWGYGIDPSFWGQNYIMYVQNALLSYIFDVLKFNRLYGYTMENNVRVISSLKSLRYVKSFIVKDYYRNITTKKFINAYFYNFYRDDYIKLKKLKKTKKSQNLNIQDINKIIIKVLSIKTNIKNDLKMTNLKKWDSISHMQIISMIEKKFSVTFANKDIPEMSSSKIILKKLNDN